MAQLNVRLDEAVVRRFEATAAALGLSNRDAVTEALTSWSEKNADALRAVISGPRTAVPRSAPEPTPPVAEPSSPAPMAAPPGAPRFLTADEAAAEAHAEEAAAGRR